MAQFVERERTGTEPFVLPTSALKETFCGKRILVAMCGSASVLMVPPALAWMRSTLGVEVRAVMTTAAASMVAASAISAVTGTRAIASWEDDGDLRVPHIDLTRGLDFMIVMPATANILGQVANGLASSLVSTCILAAECQVAFAPSMNRTMWNKLSTRRNVATLRSDGYVVVEPLTGYSLSEGVLDEAGMADVVTILAGVARLA